MENVGVSRSHPSAHYLGFGQASPLHVQLVFPHMHASGSRGPALFAGTKNKLDPLVVSQGFVVTITMLHFLTQSLKDLGTLFFIRSDLLQV